MRPFGTDTHQQHGDQADQPQAVEPGRPSAKDRRIQLSEYEHHHKGNAQANTLCLDHINIPVSTTVKHKKAATDEQQQKPQENRVQMQR